MITEGFYLGRFDPKATKATLWNYLETEVTFAKQRDELSKRNEIALVKRRDDLLEANNRYLNRARMAEMLAAERQIAIEALQDKIDFMQGEYDAAVAQHLEQDTWARMEIEKQKNLVSDWRLEAKAWAELYGKERQNNEQEYIRVNEFLRQLSVNARIMLLFDLLICLSAFLVLAGAIPPVVDIFGWWN